MRVLALLFIAHVAVTATVSAQTLADVARKESERRQTVPGGSKSYTNTDLKPVPGAPAADGAGAADPADATKPEPANADANADPAKTPAADTTKEPAGDVEVKDQAYWSKRMADLKEQLERDQTYLDALQARVDSLTADFVNRDDPAQRGQIASDRQKALAEIDRLKKAIEQGKTAIPELEEEARRAGVPAGWLR
jgi:prefoldin subunit 5